MTFTRTVEQSDFKRPILIGFLLFLPVMLAVHAIPEIAFGIRTIAAMEIAFAIYTLTLLFFVLRRPFSIWFARITVLPSILVLLLAMFHPDTPKNAFIWIFPIPMLAYSLLGKKPGFMITLATSLLALIAYLYKFGEPAAGKTLLAITDAMICMSTVWVISHLYEQHRERIANILRQQASTDALTGLDNRRDQHGAFRQLAATVDRKQPMLALLILDIDHFKQVNDQWGHDAGDAVLVHVARLMRGTLRQTDRVFRTGGEEFCLYLTVDSRDGAIKAAESLRQLIADQPCQYGDTAIPLSASIGISVYPTDGNDHDMLIQLADQRMYQAKKLGRNRVIASSSAPDIGLVNTTRLSAAHS